MTDKGATPQCCRPLFWSVLVIILALTGCVTKESYTQQVNRTTNLQRLLADEERRNSELNTEIARLKSQVDDLEAQNKLISDQLKDARAQVVRSLEEVGRLQEEIQTHRTSVKSKRRGIAPAPTEPPDRLDELQFEALGTDIRNKASETTGEKIGVAYHEVKRGDTLFSIAKRYRTNVKHLQELNGLTGDMIRVGERLVVNENP